jgi:hypothetical protein
MGCHPRSHPTHKVQLGSAGAGWDPVPRAGGNIRLLAKGSMVSGTAKEYQNSWVSNVFCQGIKTILR